MADEDGTGCYTVERIVGDGGYAHSFWTTVMADCAEDAARIAMERTTQGETLDPATEDPDGETVLTVRSDADSARAYTFERTQHAFNGRITVWADNLEEATMIALEWFDAGRLPEQKVDADGEPVLIVRAVVGFHRPIADDLADAIR